MESVGKMRGYLEFYRGKRVLVTGHTGFKGSWMCRTLALLGADVIGYSLPAPTEPNLFGLAGLEGKIHSIISDIRDRDSLQKVFLEVHPEVVFHLAAQPIVRIGYTHPAETYETNVMGTVNLLECVRQAAIKGDPPLSVVNITTDKVYLNREWFWGYREDDPLDGYDPYSNSKSCSDLVTHSYCSSFFQKQGIPVSTARAGNVIGGGDFAKDRIIPDCVRAALDKRPIIVRNPHSTRPYQHVLEPIVAYMLLAARQAQNPELEGAYNVGPDDCDCVTTGALVELFCSAWGEGMRWENHTETNAPHEANFLKLDCSKIKSTLGWSPCWHISDAIAKTVEWTKVWQSGGSVPAVMDKQIQEYLEIRGGRCVKF